MNRRARSANLNLASGSKRLVCDTYGDAMAHSRTDHPLLFDCTPALFSLQVVADTLTNARACR